MEYCIGLDVSQRQTAICINDGSADRIREGKALIIPADIHDWIIKHVGPGDIVKIGHEAEAMSFWLQTELTKLGLPIECLKAFQAAPLLETQRNKTDKSGARGLAQIVRIGGEFIRPVIMRSQSNQEGGALLTIRKYPVDQKLVLRTILQALLSRLA